jgi:hypothetical protein
MGTVKEWCDKTGCGIELGYSPDQSGYGVLCEGVDTWDENLCQALLAACVEANRKLNGGRMKSVFKLDDDVAAIIE